MSKKIIFILVCLSIVISLIALNSFIGKNQFKRVIINNYSILVEIADTDEKRSRGLSGRVSLAKDSGMLFVFPSKGTYSFWMKEMLIPLDFIWINDDTVVDLTENVQPPEKKVLDTNLSTYSPKYVVDKVLEVNAGVIKSLNIKIGDKVRYQ